MQKFDRDGKFIRQWGSTGKGPGQFTGVKSLAIDAQGNVWYTDITGFVGQLPARQARR